MFFLHSFIIQYIALNCIVLESRLQSTDQNQNSPRSQQRLREYPKMSALPKACKRFPDNLIDLSHRCPCNIIKGMYRYILVFVQYSFSVDLYMAFTWYQSPINWFSLNECFQKPEQLVNNEGGGQTYPKLIQTWSICQNKSTALQAQESYILKINTNE